jgi:hypothetical protein
MWSPDLMRGNKPSKNIQHLFGESEAFALRLAETHI